MRILPLQIKNQIIEIGYKGHSRWGLSSLRSGVTPTIIGDFHLFINFKAKQDKRRCTSNVHAKTIVMYDEFKDCTVNERGVLYIWKQKNHLSVLDNCVPYPPDEFFTDFGAWTLEHEICFPVPEEFRREAGLAALGHLKYMQRVLDAHLRYWDKEGRPPIRQLSVAEVLEYYDTGSR